MAEALSRTARDLYLPQPATILSKTPLTATEMFFRIELDSGEPLNHMPGQFVAVTVPGVGESPLSVSSPPDRTNVFQLMVRRAGRVTGALHARQCGEKIGVRGPFGKHYPVDGAMKGRNLVFAAGGIGLAPLRSAIHYVLNHRADYGKVTILYGIKSPAERLFVDELAAWSSRPDVELMETVDRADADWKGNVGVITSLIPKALSGVTRPIVLTCGPPIMYKFVIVSLHAAGVADEDIYLSLERRMKCGIGKCGHCMINGLYACMDGAVFRYADIAPVQEAI
jgi:sulfhydrogenase subunit gamma (sulfur reductase)